MIEIPEAYVLAQQLNQTIAGKRVRRVIAAHTPHAFAWYYGDPAGYSDLLVGRMVGQAVHLGGMVEIEVEDTALLFGDGVNLRYHPSLEGLPLKHQLLVEFDDYTAMSAGVAMYGGLWCYQQGANDNPYYLVARQKPSPLSPDFDEPYFESLFVPEHMKLPLKAFLATQQRIPGFGNGVLQDILYRAGLHPRYKVSLMDATERARLFFTIKDTLKEMSDLGGRDTERNLFGESGGYPTQMSKNTVGKGCVKCASPIQKQAYLGGSIYFCPVCQKVGK